jgi:iron-sulfur cluster repair protein YtfE (RIC family)
MMNAIQLLKQQHQDVRDLFERIEQAEDTSEKENILRELADNLAAHMTIEETIFYPAAFTSDESRYSEAVKEHASAKRLLVELLEMSTDDEKFDDKVTKLQEEVEHHVEEEESQLFKTAKQELEADELKRLGDEMKNLFDEEMAAQPSRSLSGELAEVEEEETDEVELDSDSEAEYAASSE